MLQIGMNKHQIRAQLAVDEQVYHANGGQTKAYDENGELLGAYPAQPEHAQAVIIRVLAEHGIELWKGYAVSTYLASHCDEHGKARHVPGESFKPLASFAGAGDVFAWLGY